MKQTNQNRWIKVVAIIALLLTQKTEVNAQGFLKKMQAKLESALYSTNNWYIFYEDMDDKKKSTTNVASSRFKVVDENTISDDDNSDWDGTRSASIKNYTKTKVGNSMETIFMDGNTHHNGIIKISDTTYMKICFKGENKLENLVLLKLYTNNDKVVFRLIKEYDKAADYKVMEKYLKAYMSAWDEKYGSEKAEAKKKSDAYDASFELPAPSAFTPLSQKQLMDAAEINYNPDGKVKIIYCYFASPKYAKLKNQTEWAPYKENKTVRGTYDKYITKRTLDVVMVMQYSDNKDNFFIRHATIAEDAAFDVWDGSKFTGKYYFMNAGACLHPGVPEKNAMKYKKALK